MARQLRWYTYIYVYIYMYIYIYIYVYIYTEAKINRKMTPNGLRMHFQRANNT